MAKNIKISSSSNETSIRTNANDQMTFTSSATTTSNNTSKQKRNSATKRIILNPSSESSSYTQSINLNHQSTSTNRRSNKKVASTSALKNGDRIISYVEEIRKMMHAFGDVRLPLIESARLIESIVRHQMTMLLLEAQRVAHMRHSSSSSPSFITTNSSKKHINVEDFIFLLRHDQHRLAKLIRYLKFKDTRLKVLSSTLVEGDNKSSSAKQQSSSTRRSKITKSQLECLYNDIKTELEIDDTIEWSRNGQTNACEGESRSSSSFETNTSSKRVKFYQDILGTIIQTPQNRCEMERLLSNYPNISIDTIDNYTSARNRRLCEFTEQMSVKEYLYYQSCRSVTFFGSSTSSQTISQSMFHKFQEWILKSFDDLDRLELRPNSLGWEVVQYFAHETVAILVELSLIVRQDRNRHCKMLNKYQGAAIYPGTLTNETMPSKRFRQEELSVLSKTETLSKSCTKMTKCDPMINVIDFDYKNNMNGFKKSANFNEQFIVDVLRRTSEKVKAFQASTSSMTTTTTTNNDNHNNINNNSITTTNSRTSNNNNNNNSIINAITTEHIFEAMRLFELGSTNVFNRFQRCHGWLYGQNSRNRILCLHC